MDLAGAKAAIAAGQTALGVEFGSTRIKATLIGPDFAPLAKLIAQRGWTPRFICESAGTQAEDAKQMMDMYLASQNA